MQYADPVDIDLHHYLKTIEAADARDDAIADEAERLEKRPQDVMALLRVHAKPGSEIKSAYDDLILMLATAEVDARGNE